MKICNWFNLQHDLQHVNRNYLTYGIYPGFAVLSMIGYLRGNKRMLEYLLLLENRLTK